MVLVLIVLPLVVDITTGSIGLCSGLRAIFRRTRSKKVGTRIIEIPERLQSYLTGGAVKPGSELVIGLEHEWNGEQLKRVAIKSRLLPYPDGTILKVVRIYQGQIEVIESDRSI